MRRTDSNRNEGGTTETYRLSALTTQLTLDGATLGTVPTERRAPPWVTTGQVFGHYRIVRSLGAGGMAQVYEAEDLENGRRVALKLLPLARSERSRKRFLREGRLAARVNHPNSVYVFGTEEIEGFATISMEIISGGSLQDLLAQGQPVPIGDGVVAILNVIDGLAAAESKGVLHRDIKPSNCFVTPDGTVKIGDYGLSFSTFTGDESKLTAEGTLLGTPAFSSPEQLRGEAADIRSDIYSVGGTLYCLLTGRPPFQAAGPVQLISAVMSDDPPGPRTHRAEIPKGLEQIIKRCLSRDPAKRFDSYAELRSALSRYRVTQLPSAAVAARLVAAVIDLPAAILIALVIAKLLPLPYFSGASIMVMILYFALPEGLWGATAAKWLLGVRVVGPRGRVPGLPRALGRHAFILAALGAASFVDWKIAWLPLALLWITARRDNGISTIRDLVTGTRVVDASRNGRDQPVAKPDTATDELGARDLSGETVGPYVVRGVLQQGEDSQLLLAYDNVLRRSVWVRTGGIGSFSADRCDVARHSRIRWLSGKQAGEASWDAFEALDGQSILKQAQVRNPWRTVRVWLSDLAEELEAAGSDGTLPSTIRLSNLWITSAGRLKLLDFQMCQPGHRLERLAWSTTNPAFVQKLLASVARFALEGPQATADTQSGEPPAVPLPLDVRELLGQLGRGESADGIQTIRERLQNTLRGPADVSRRKRAQYLLLVAAPGLVLFVLSLAALLRQTIKDDNGIVIDSFESSFTIFLVFLTLQLSVGLPFALLFRGGLVLRATGLALVNRKGKPAHRLIALMRALIAWCAPLAVLLLFPGISSELRYVVAVVYCALGLLMTLAGKTEIRGRLVGVRLVPRQEERATAARQEAVETTGGLAAWLHASNPRAGWLRAVALWVAVIGLVLGGVRIVEAIVVPIRPTQRTLYHRPQERSAFTASGLVRLGLSHSGLEVKPGEPGQPLRIDVTHSPRYSALRESIGEGPDSSWIYEFSLLSRKRVHFFRKHPKTNVIVHLPPDFPIDLQLDLRQSANQLELGGLSLTSIDVMQSAGGLVMSFSEPLQHPLESLEIRTSLGEVTLHKVGNASPRHIDAHHGVGELRIDLVGDWVENAEADVEMRWGVLRLRRPGKALLTGIDDQSTPISSPAGGSMPLPTVHVTTRVTAGELKLVNPDEPLIPPPPSDSNSEDL